MLRSRDLSRKYEISEATYYHCGRQIRQNERSRAPSDLRGWSSRKKVSDFDLASIRYEIVVRHLSFKPRNRAPFAHCESIESQT